MASLSGKGAPINLVQNVNLDPNKLRNRPISETPESFDKIDSMDHLIEAAGTKGRRNYLIFFLLAWGSFVNPFISLSYQFIGATPKFWCQAPELEEANWTNSQIMDFSLPKNLNRSISHHLESCTMMNLNYTQAQQLGYEAAMKKRDDLSIDDTPIHCQSRTFDPEEAETVVTKWDLVCERRFIYSTTQAVVMMGKLVGSALMGYVMNLIGRKMAISICIPLYLIIGLVMTLSPNVEVYIALKFFLSAISMTFYLAGMVLSFELCTTSQRSMIGALYGIPFALGYMAMPAVAYFVRSFTYLQIAITIPILTSLPNLWIIPESPRWLVLKGRHRKATKILKKIAHHNKRTLPSDESMISYMKKVYAETEKENRKGNPFFASFYDAFRLMLNPTWLWKILILFFGWFAVSLVYYGVSLNSPNLSQDKYLYMFLGGVLEVPSYIFLWPAGKYIGRRTTLVSLFAVCALAIFGAAGLTFYEYPDGQPSAIHSWLLFQSLLGKFAITAAFQLIWIYTTELIPTEQRSALVGVCSMFARVGGIFSPYIVDLLGEKTRWAPSAIFGGLSIACAILIAFLPETKNERLVDST